MKSFGCSEGWKAKVPSIKSIGHKYNPVGRVPELDGSGSENSSFMLVDHSPILIEPTKRADRVPDTEAEDSSTGND